MGLSLQNLLWYADEGEDMVNRIVTEDESWVHHPSQIMFQCNGNIPVHLQPTNSKFKVTPSAGKVMLTMFWDSQGVLLSHFQKHGENVNSASYCEVLLSFWMQFTENVQANWQEGYCFSMTVQDPMQSEQPRREFKNYEYMGNS
jgi:hypothetical protein